VGHGLKRVPSPLAGRFSTEERHSLLCARSFRFNSDPGPPKLGCVSDDVGPFLFLKRLLTVFSTRLGVGLSLVADLCGYVAVPGSIPLPRAKYV